MNNRRGVLLLCPASRSVQTLTRHQNHNVLSFGVFMRWKLLGFLCELVMKITFCNQSRVCDYVVVLVQNLSPDHCCSALSSVKGKQASCLIPPLLKISWDSRASVGNSVAKQSLIVVVNDRPTVCTESATASFAHIGSLWGWNKITGDHY